MRSKEMEEKVFIDTRFGFPVEIRGVKLRMIRGEEVPVVNANHLRLAVIAGLILKPGRLTGHEVRFLRLWMELTLTQLGEELGVTHPAVFKWEGKENHPANMGKAVEIHFRLLVLSKFARTMEEQKSIAAPKTVQQLEEKIPFDSAGPLAFGHMLKTVATAVKMEPSTTILQISA
jgi:hypothetical protein